jgi:DNA-binding Lrp family transcriptional regulator
MLRTQEKERLIKKLQGDIPLELRPFAAMARELGWKEEQVLSQLRTWKKSGTVRRIGAILAHRKVGYRANAMSIWEVPRNKVSAVGRIIAQFSEVSHCYERASPPGWRHNVFAMIHARTRAECRAIARAIAAKTGIEHYELLLTVKEFKKESPRYF